MPSSAGLSIANLATLVVVGLLATCASADYILWLSIGQFVLRTEINPVDGSHGKTINFTFTGGANAFAASDEYLYWGYVGGIGRAKLDGTSAEPKWLQSSEIVVSEAASFQFQNSSRTLFFGYQQLNAVNVDTQEFQTLGNFMFSGGGGMNGNLMLNGSSPIGYFGLDSGESGSACAGGGIVTTDVWNGSSSNPNSIHSLYCQIEFPRLIAPLRHHNQLLACGLNAQNLVLIDASTGTTIAGISSAGFQTGLNSATVSTRDETAYLLSDGVNGDSGVLYTVNLTKGRETTHYEMEHWLAMPPGVCAGCVGSVQFVSHDGPAPNPHPPLPPPPPPHNGNYVLWLGQKNNNIMRTMVDPNDGSAGATVSFDFTAGCALFAASDEYLFFVINGIIARASLDGGSNNFNWYSKVSVAMNGVFTFQNSSRSIFFGYQQLYALNVDTMKLRKLGDFAYNGGGGMNGLLEMNGTNTFGFFGIDMTESTNDVCDQGGIMTVDVWTGNINTATGVYCNHYDMRFPRLLQPLNHRNEMIICGDVTGKLGVLNIGTGNVTSLGNAKNGAAIAQDDSVAYLTSSSGGLFLLDLTSYSMTQWLPASFGSSSQILLVAQRNHPNGTTPSPPTTTTPAPTHHYTTTPQPTPPPPPTTTTPPSPPGKRPYIIKLMPSHGPYAGGTMVFVEGTGFVRTKSCVCRFGFIVVRAQYLNSELLKCASPPSALVGSLAFSVSMGGEWSNTLPFRYDNTTQSSVQLK